MKEIKYIILYLVTVPVTVPVPLVKKLRFLRFRFRFRFHNTVRILLSSCKIIKKNLDSCYFVTLFDFLSLKNYVNIASKSISRKNCVKKLVFVGILKVNDENSRIRMQDPDPLVRGMDPRIRIHSKMSGIRNTAFLDTLLEG
jgi:hypothetical protein